ncbi:amidase family protein, partial [Streptomyces caeruleatus]|uniref:amidase family protein n=1 Tax=Streptomyces caeruleatus TaxID=661399 RepID=UPI001FC98587
GAWGGGLRGGAAQGDGVRDGAAQGDGVRGDEVRDGAARGGRVRGGQVPGGGPPGAGTYDGPFGGQDRSVGELGRPVGADDWSGGELGRPVGADDWSGGELGRPVGAHDWPGGELGRPVGAHDWPGRELGRPGDAHDRLVGRYDAPTAVWSPDLGFDSPDPDVVAVAHATAVRLAEADAIRLVRPRSPLRLEDPAPAWLALRASDSASRTPDAHRIRAANDRRLADLFTETELLLTPTAPTPPHGHDGPGDRYSTALTWAFNLSGHPAISIPAGLDGDGCPVGLQLVAAHGGEALLIEAARAAEAAVGPWTGWTG